jgi:hypothetical protein
MSDDTQRWRRLTILDILLLFPTFAMGAAIVRYMIDHPSPDSLNTRSWPMDATIFGQTFVALVLGGIFAAPVSLSSQFIFRRRREWLSFAEWFWLEPILMYVITYLVSMFGQPILMLWLVCALMLQLFFSIAALAMLAMFWTCIWDRQSEVEFRWTDILGCITCGCCGIMVLYLLNTNLITI